MIDKSSIFTNDRQPNDKNEDVRYFTFQGDYTLESLENDGAFTSYINNDTLREGEFEFALGQRGLVYYSIYRNLKSIDDIYNPNLGENLIELDVNKLPEKRIEVTCKEFDEIENVLRVQLKLLKDSITGEPSVEQWDNVVKDICGFDEEFFFKKREFDETNKMFGVMSVLTKDMIKRVYRKL